MTLLVNNIPPVLAFDTNIIIDYLHGLPQAKTLLDKCVERVISAVVVIEVLAGQPPSEHRQLVRFFESQFRIVHTDMEICLQATLIRQKLRLKMGDALILATARAEGLQLATRDQDFDPYSVDVLVPYKV